MLWMDQAPLFPGRSYLIRIGNKTTSASFTAIKYKINVNTGEHLAAESLALNEIGFCNVSCSTPVAFDPYSENRKTGAFIVVDRFTNRTVGAGRLRLLSDAAAIFIVKLCLLAKPTAPRSIDKSQWSSGSPACRVRESPQSPTSSSKSSTSLAITR